MQRDRDRWNEKYRKKPHSFEPSSIVKQHYALAPIGKALDIATGNGRNALFLADRGFTVEAVDIADEILKDLSLRHAKVHPICADLDDFDITGSRYSLILNIRFLNRRLFPYIQEGLIPGGILIFETYMDMPLEAEPDAFCRDYLLRTNELLQDQGWTVVRIWEHVPSAEAADRVAAAVSQGLAPDHPGLPTTLRRPGE